MAKSNGLNFSVSIHRQFCCFVIAFYIGSRVSASGSDFVWPFRLFLAVGIVNYLYKFCVALLMTPVIYWVHALIENYLGSDLATKMKQAALADD